LLAYKQLSTTLKKKLGFSLLELMMVLAVVGILSVMAVNAYEEYMKKTRQTQAMVDISTIQMHLTNYYSEKMKYPANLAELNLSKDQKTDPWDKPYAYVNFTGMKGQGGKRKDKNLVPINSDYDLYSSGPDGISRNPLTAKHSHDDIIRANNGGFIGIAKDY